MIRGGAQSDTLPQGRRDSLRAGRPDTIPLTDSLKKTIDSVRRYQDSLKKADTVLSAAAMLRQIDSLNTRREAPVDTVKQRLDAMLNAVNNQSVNSRPGLPGTLPRQPNPGYSPGSATAGGAPAGGAAPTNGASRATAPPGGPTRTPGGSPNTSRPVQPSPEIFACTRRPDPHRLGKPDPRLVDGKRSQRQCVYAGLGQLGADLDPPACRHRTAS